MHVLARYVRNNPIGDVRMSGDRQMVTKSLRAAGLVVALMIATEASARMPAPMIPTALVEDVKSTTAGVEFMDYLGTGQVIKLEPRDVLVLSYLKSCAHEIITGGTVSVGAERSEVQGGNIVRAKVPCDGGKMRLTSEQANTSAASAFRLQSVDHEPVLYARVPMIQLPKLHADESRTLVIERTDRPVERFEIKIDERLADGGFYDLAKDNKTLTRGATYNASIGLRKITFKVDARAKSSNAPVVSRLLRIQ
jgi:hypothetical protein